MPDGEIVDAMLSIVSSRWGRGRRREGDEAAREFLCASAKRLRSATGELSVPAAPNAARGGVPVPWLIVAENPLLGDPLAVPGSGGRYRFWRFASCWALGIPVVTSPSSCAPVAEEPDWPVADGEGNGLVAPDGGVRGRGYSRRRCKLAPDNVRDGEREWGLLGLEGTDADFAWVTLPVAKGFGTVELTATSLPRRES